MENTLEALKGAYKIAYEELGLNNALTREIGSLIVRFSRGQGGQVLEELKRAVNQSRQQIPGKPATSYEVFIHPLQVTAQAGGAVEPGQENQPPPSLPAAAEVEPVAPAAPVEPVAPAAPVKPDGPFDIDLTKTTANAIAKEYTKGEIIATLSAKGIKPDPGKQFDDFNPRQLAALLINQGKK